MSSELSSLLEISTRDIAALENLVTETRNIKTPKQTPVIVTNSSRNETATKSTVAEVESEPILDFLKKRPATKSADDSKPVPTILDMLSPGNETDSWGDDSDVDTKKPRAPSFDKLKGRRSASDNSVRLQGKRESKEKAGNECQNVLDSLAHALEDDDSFLDSSFEKNYATWKQTSTVRAHFDSIRSMTFHREHPVLLTASDDCTLKLWKIDAATKK